MEGNQIRYTGHLLDSGARTPVLKLACLAGRCETCGISNVHHLGNLAIPAETVEKGLDSGQFLFGLCWIMIL